MLCPLKLMSSLCLALGICYSSDAQIRTWQLSLVDSTQDYLYVGVENAVEIEGLPAGATVKIGYGTITITGSDFFIRPHPYPYYHKARQLYRDTLTVIKNGKVIYSKVFVVDYLKDPKVVLAGVKGNVISVQQVLNHPQLSVYIDSSYLKPYFHVVAYEIEFDRQQIDSYPTRVRGDSLEKEQLDIVRALRPGNKIIISDITVTCPECRLRNLGSLNYTIR